VIQGRENNDRDKLMVTGSPTKGWFFGVERREMEKRV
jgi:hypothetical protein